METRETLWQNICLLRVGNKMCGKASTRRQCVQRPSNLWYLIIENTKQPIGCLMASISLWLVAHVICLPRDSTSTCETGSHRNLDSFRTTDWIQVSLIECLV